MEERVRGPAFLDISALAACLIGFLGLISMFLQFKAGVLGIPRILYLVFIAMICAPFYVALVRIPKFLFLIPPVIALFLIYPICAPYGIPFGTDPIFNTAFAANVVRSGFWDPGTGNAFSRVYSFYPLGNVFIGYIVQTTGQPATTAFMWVHAILRLLALPAAVFAIGRRLFSTRNAVLGLFFYLGTASILFNTPVQQGIGIIFVSLSLLAIVILTRSADKSSQRRTQVLFVFVAGGIVMTHHLSSYIFAGWLATLALLMARHRFRPIVGSLRLGVLFVYFVFVLGAYIFFFTYHIFASHEQNLELVINRFLTPESFPTSPSPGLGRTFATEEVAWLAGSVLVLLLLALVSVYRFRASREHPFAVANGIVAGAVTLITLPLVATGFSFVPLRIGEYTNLFIGPFAATTLIRWGGIVTSRWSQILPRFTQNREWVPRAACLLVAVLIFMGGNLAPSAPRQYFELPQTRTTDTALNFGADVQRASKWADAHFDTSRVWGDSLAVDAFAGFANMEVDFGNTRVFQAFTLGPGLWCPPTNEKSACGSLLRVGDYIAVDRFMLIERPNFFLESALPGPLSPVQVGKFARDPHLSLVYQDASFSVYRVMSNPLE